MRGVEEWVGSKCRGTGYAVLLLSVLLSACAPVPDPSAGLSVEQSVALISQVEASDIAIEAIAEAFALNTRATDVQRENLQAELVGRRVEWDIPVYEVSFSEGRYEVTSQPIPIQDPNATPLIRVMISVIPLSGADEALLQAVKTDDVIRVRGIVQEIRLRMIVAIVPAIVVPARANASQHMRRRFRKTRHASTLSTSGGSDLATFRRTT